MIQPGCQVEKRDSLVGINATGALVSCGAGRYERTIGLCRADGDLGRAMMQVGMTWAFRRYSRDFVEDEGNRRGGQDRAPRLRSAPAALGTYVHSHLTRTHPLGMATLDQLPGWHSTPTLSVTIQGNAVGA